MRATELIQHTCHVFHVALCVCQFIEEKKNMTANITINNKREKKELRHSLRVGSFYTPLEKDFCGTGTSPYDEAKRIGIYRSLKLSLFVEFCLLKFYNEK